MMKFSALKVSPLGEEKKRALLALSFCSFPVQSRDKDRKTLMVVVMCENEKAFDH